jgi:hypothetical protein
MNRDDGLRRIRWITGWTLAGTVGAAGVFAGIAAHAHPGAASTAKKSSSSSQGATQLQPTTVLPSTSSNTPTVVSGAS